MKHQLTTLFPEYDPNICCGKSLDCKQKDFTNELNNSTK